MKTGPSLVARLAFAPPLLAAACAPATPSAVPTPTPPPVPVMAAEPSAAPSSSAASRSRGAPVAPVREVKDTYFGVTVTDPYRWMEQDSPELSTWMRAQADYTRAWLDRLPQRAALRARILELDTASERATDVQRAGAYVFCRRRGPTSDLFKLVVREGFGGPERVLVDPEAMSGGGKGDKGDKGDKSDKHFALDWYAPSLDGKLVAYGVSVSGSEDSVLRVLDTATGKPRADAFDRMQFGSVSWIDGKRFFYTRLQKLAPGAPATERYKRATAYVHTLGSNADADPAVLGAGVSPDVAVGELEVGTAQAFFKSANVFGVVQDGVRRELALYAAPVAALAGPKTPWKKVTDASDDVTSFDVHGDDLYLLSHKDALRFKVLKTSASKPDLAHATVVVPESDLVIKAFAASADALYLHVVDAGIGRVRRVPYGGGAAVDVKLPIDGAIEGMFGTAEYPGVHFRLEGWTTSARYFVYDAAKKAALETKLLAPSPVDFSSIVATELKAKSADGTLVPLSVLAKKDLVKDGGHPTLLEGYGAYGISIDPFFSSVQLAWLERGGVLAFCHVRGGGELGEGWHRDGMLLKKQHTVDDFLGCAQALVDAKYTSPARLAGEGTSAGGILIGGAITERPDLFGAAVSRVGVSNALRFENTLNVLNIPEFGTVKTEDGFHALQIADVYSKVKDGTKYPAVLLTTGATDPRVAPWQVTKMAARLQAATASDKPVLLRVDYDAGHGMGSTRTQRDEELADEYAFLLAALSGK